MAMLLPVCLIAQVRQPSQQMPVIPVGFDAYRMWDQLPLQRIGVRAYMRSTYDRAGGGNDASHFLFMNQEDDNVTLDVKGTGVLYFFRANHWHGSPWHFKIDGVDNVIKETATDSPVNARKIFKTTSFYPANTLAQPMDWTWGITKGADLIWTPMPFRDSMSIAYSRTHYGTGYYIYHIYANPESLSQPIAPWGIGQAPDKRVIDLMDSAGMDIAPKNIKTLRGTIQLKNRSSTLAFINASPSSVRALKITLPMDKAMDLEHIHLRVTWDGAKYPSIDAPLCQFFGAGTFFNREKKEYLVKGLPINVRYDYKDGKVELACYYPMPFFKSARFELTGAVPGNTAISYEIRYERLKTPANLSSYFHATYSDIPKPQLGQDMTWLDTQGIEGHRDWSGSFMGTSFIFSHNANLSTLEGDPRFFFDDSQTPQAYGTGTEEWAGGGDYWGGENMTLPLAGHPCGSTSKKTAVNDEDLIQSAYRFLMADMMPFGKRAVIRFEHSENVSQEHYEAVTYWYGLPALSLLKTDSLNIGNLPDEQRHNYTSPQASAVEMVHSRYEWGPDVYPATAYGYDLNKMYPNYQDLAGKEIYPAHDENGRHTTGTSEFTVRISPDNKGVLLRRKLDYSYPNQTAEVYISVTGDGKTRSNNNWVKAGTWYLAGANTCVFSSPDDELGKRKYEVQTSDRRFRDDEFLIPAKLTRHTSKIKVRIKFIPNDQELYPGHPFPNKSCWSELGYSVYSYVLPDYKVK